jgi:8-oxo-dGTP diphosphatase
METFEWPKVPYVGVGCVVIHDEQVLLVRGRRGLWSPPGGHLDFGESPADAAVRETKEETGIDVTSVEFIAITNDVLDDVAKHYVTIWMRGETTQSAVEIQDTDEILEACWFALDALPEPRFQFFDNLIAGRSMPADPGNLPNQLRRR